MNILKNAWQNSFSHIGGFGAVLSLLAIPIVGFVLHYFARGWLEMSAQLDVWVFYGLAAPAMVISTIFVSNLIRAPLRIELIEAKKENEKLSKYNRVDGMPINIRNNNYFIMVEENLNNKEDEYHISESREIIYASVEIKNGNIIIKEDINISSITDYGVGEFCLNFTHSIDDTLMITSSVGSTPPFEIISATKDSVRVKFLEEPEQFRIRVDAPNVSRRG